LTTNTPNKHLHVLYLGAGHCAELDSFIAAKNKSVTLVDANPEICNFLEYETRNASHINVVHAAVTAHTKNANFKIYNLEDLSSLNTPIDPLGLYPGLVLKREIAVKTIGFQDILKTNIPARGRFDLIIDVSGSEGDITQELLKSSCFKRVENLTIFTAATPFFEGATSAEDLIAMLSEQGITTTIEADESSDFVRIQAQIDHAALEKLASRKKLSALDRKLKQSQKRLLKSDKLKEELGVEVKNLTTALDELNMQKEEAVETSKQAKLKNQVLNKTIEDLHSQLDVAISKQEKSLKDLAELQGQNNHLSQQLEDLKNEITTFSKSHSDLTLHLEAAQLAKQESKKYQADLQDKNIQLTQKIKAIENELKLTKSMDTEMVNNIRDTMKNTYENILGDLTHQVTTLTTISKTKSEQMDQIFADRAELEEKIKQNDVANDELTKAYDQIDDLKGKLAEREASLKWHKRRFETQMNKLNQTAEPSNSELTADNILKSSPPPRKIIVASVPRSGGTWVYNIIRGIFEVQKISYASGWVADFDGPSDVEYHVIKLHQPDELNCKAWKVITNHRPLEQRVASLIRMNWVDNSDDGIRDAIQHQANLYKFWDEKSDLEVQFQRIKTDPRGIISDIASLFGIELSDEAVSKVLSYVKGLKIPAEKPYDPVSLFHPRHIVSNVKKHNSKVAYIQKLMEDKK